MSRRFQRFVEQLLVNVPNLELTLPTSAEMNKIYNAFDFSSAFDERIQQNNLIHLRWNTEKSFLGTFVQYPVER